MKLTYILAAGAAAMTLAACGNSADEKPRKGKYKPAVELTELDLPGMTDQLKAAAQEQMQKSFAAQAGGEQCIGGTNESDWKEAANGISDSLGGECETIKDNGTDSTADLEIKCTGTQMGNVTVTMTGEAKSESFEMNIGFDMDKLPQGGNGKMGMKLTGSRIGDC